MQRASERKSTIWPMFPGRPYCTGISIISSFWRAFGGKRSYHQRSRVRSPNGLDRRACAGLHGRGARLRTLGGLPLRRGAATRPASDAGSSQGLEERPALRSPCLAGPCGAGRRRSGVHARIHRYDPGRSSRRIGFCRSRLPCCVVVLLRGFATRCSRSASDGWR